MQKFKPTSATRKPTHWQHLWRVEKLAVQGCEHVWNLDMEADVEKREERQERETNSGMR